jgi:hypothetical protein
MPFDGSEFLGTPLLGSGAVAPRPATWLQRLRQSARAWLPGGATTPLRAFMPGAPPETVTLQVLTLARALIEDERNWVQRRYETLGGRRCAVGALRSAARLLELRSPQRDAADLLLSVAMSRGYSDIEKMNDNSTHGQVLSAFDEAIVRARQRTH